MRILLRALSALLGLAVVALGAVIALEVVWAWVRPASGPLLVPWLAWQETLTGWTWSGTPVRLVAAGLIVAGLLLLLVALRSGGPEVRLINPVPEVTVVTSARSLARLVGNHVRELEGVASASVTATASKVTVRATSRQPGSDATLQISDSVRTLLAELPLAGAPRVSVAVRTTGKSA
ncbi:MAG: hypothetical protein DLM60_22785 [Pseudonocardiales bacterium]|nr:DUF6286 domain-containing protein [Actinomycetota bacterium]PZS12224.1 MAG: hypothetical protein DLM60_22785 [Pseudonocardiales bacterium]